MDKINWKKVRRIAGWVFTLSALVLILAFATGRQKDMNCKSIQITMLDSERFTSRQQIAATLNAHHLINTKINMLEIESLQNEFRKNPFISQATLSVDLSGILTVKIAQKHPFILVVNEKGQRFFIDRLGMKMPFANHDTSRFFKVSGKIGEGFSLVDTLHSASLKGVFFLGSYLDRNASLKKRYKNLFIDQQNELEILPDTGPVFLLGDTSALDEKFTKLDLMYSTVFPREGMDKYSCINLKYTDQMVCMRKGEPADSLNGSKNMQPVSTTSANHIHTTKTLKPL